MNPRKVKLSVTNFIFCGDEWLFLDRNMDKKIDPGMKNGVGGKVENGENYLEAVIRETKEETGYDITPENIQLAGVVHLEGGYDDDWVMCFFRTEVKSKDIPMGNVTDDGELVWVTTDQALNADINLVDDVKTCIGEIISGTSTFFMNATIDENFKVTAHTITKLPF